MELPLRTPDTPAGSPGGGLDGPRLVSHRRGLWRYLRFLGAEPGLADDLTQETFVRLLSRPFEDRGPLAVDVWLRRTAANLFRAAGRQLRRGLDTIDPEQLEQGWARLVAADPSGDRHLEALDRCLAALDERGRTALRLRHGEGVDREELARRLGLSVEGLKSVLRRARERLRRCVRRRMEGAA